MMNNSSTTEKCQYSVPLKSVLCTLLLLTAVLSILENLFFCIIVYKNKRLHRKSMALIVSLSITDIIIALLLPTNEFQHILFYPHWQFGIQGSRLTESIWILSIVLPFTTVLAIALERHLIMCGKARFKQHHTTKKIALVVGLLWFYSMIWVLVMVSNLTFSKQHLIPPRLYYSFLTLHILVPLFIIPVLYYKIYKKVHATRQQLHQQQEGRVSDRSKSELKLTNTIGFVIIVLFTVWFPVLVIETLRARFYDACDIKKADAFNVWLTSLSGCLNPVIYSLRSDDVKKYIMKYKKTVLTSIRSNQRTSRGSEVESLITDNGTGDRRFYHAERES